MKGEWNFRILNTYKVQTIKFKKNQTSNLKSIINKKLSVHLLLMDVASR